MEEDFRKYINALRKCANEHEKDFVPTFNIRTTDLCNDTANLLEEIEKHKGHWMHHIEYCKKNNLVPSGLGSYYWCSECECGIESDHFHRVEYNYCPKCGAKMN